jgi:PTS system nitrogen regulatory IIA component
MDDLLTLKQIAQHLQVSERTVFRLLERGELPGLKVGGHWRFRRAVVDYWLDMRMSRMEGLALLDPGSDQGGEASTLRTALALENALLPLPPGSRREVIESFVGMITLPEAVDPGEVLDRVWAREELSSTAVHGGAALLHTSRWESRTLKHGNLLAIGRLAEPVDFGAVDGRPTDLLFLILAGSPQEHLALLARTTRLCRQPRFLTQLREATTPRAVLNLVRRGEAMALAPSTSDT